MSNVVLVALLFTASQLGDPPPPPPVEDVEAPVEELREDETEGGDTADDAASEAEGEDSASDDGAFGEELESEPPPPPTPGDGAIDAPPLSEPSAGEPAASTAPEALPPADEGSGTFTTRAAQFGTGCGISGASTLANCGACMIPLVYILTGPPACACNLCVTPACIGIGVTVVGEALGDERGTIGWPILAAYGVQVATAVLVIGSGVGGYLLAVALGTGAALNFVDPGQFGDPAFIGTLVGAMAIPFVAVLGSVLVGAIAQGAVGALVYGATAEPRKPGDEGFRFPGIFSPNHPDDDELEADDDEPESVDEAPESDDEAPESDDGALEPPPPAPESSRDLQGPRVVNAIAY